MKELLKNEALFLMLEKVMGKKIGKDGIYKIQQAGQKYAGICYMDVADEFFYQCLSNTTSTVNDGALFKKIGVSENEDKLSNLYEVGDGYIKYNDGTMLCYAIFSFGNTDLEHTIQFVRPFKELYYISPLHIRPNSGSFSHIGISEGKYDIYGCTFRRVITGVTTGATCRYHAYGTWR